MTKAGQIGCARCSLTQGETGMMSDAAAHNSYSATHPEAVALRAENEVLREVLAKLITDRDYLMATMLPAIEAEYNLKTAAWNTKPTCSNATSRARLTAT